MATERVVIEPTAEHLQMAFHAYRWPGYTFDTAMADPVRARLVRGRATQLALREYERTHSHERVLVRRQHPVDKTWCTTTHPGARTVPTFIEEE